MAERKPLFMSADGWSEEMAQADSLTLGGLTMGGAIATGTGGTKDLLLDGFYYGSARPT